jgi:hypothetical protein
MMPPDLDPSHSKYCVLDYYLTAYPPKFAKGCFELF